MPSHLEKTYGNEEWLTMSNTYDLYPLSSVPSNLFSSVAFWLFVLPFYETANNLWAENMAFATSHFSCFL